MRRGRIASLILLAMLILMGLALPDAIFAPALAPSIGLIALCCVIAIPLNRAGHVNVAAAMVIALIDLGLVAALLTAPGGLDPLYIPAFYLLVTSELIAVSLLSPGVAFLLAFLHSAFILLDVSLQPHTMMWEDMITSRVIFYSMVIGPVALQFVVAFVTYLWVRSSQLALRRADRAEEIAELERREAQRSRELEEDVNVVLAAHVQLANGNFNTRVHGVRNPIIWQIASSLNNLIGRLTSFSKEQAEAQFTLYRTREEVDRLAHAIISLQSGRPATLPAPSGTPLDPVIEALQATSRAADVRGMLSSPQSQPHPASYPAPASDVDGRWPSVAPRGSAPSQDPAAHLPEWLRMP